LPSAICHLPSDADAPAPCNCCNPSSPSNSAPPFTELCSAGLAFKLAHALLKRGRETALPGAADFDLRPLLDLVALGTIADIVPLTGENRILVSNGLERLNATQRPGLIALKRVAQSPARLGTYEVGFQLAPRLNAAGRLETAEDALRLLMARNPAEALALAQNLDARNRERQKIERGMAEEVIGAVRAKFNPQTDFVIVEGHLSWHIGVVGIVASRVLQQFYRPAIILGGDGGEFRGSGRSIPGLDLAAALRAVAPGLGRAAKGRVGIDMDGEVVTITAGDPPVFTEGAKGPTSRIGRIPMTQLLVGYHSVFEIASRPDVALREEDTAVLDALFPKAWPYSQPDPYMWYEETLLEDKPFIAEEPWRSKLAAHPRPWAL